MLDPIAWALIIVALILVIGRLRKRGARKPSRFGLRSKSFRPWDQEAELLRLCHGDKATAERLIQHEIDRAPEMSRAGAALAAATRLKHDKQ